MWDEEDEAKGAGVAVGEDCCYSKILFRVNFGHSFYSI